MSNDFRTFLVKRNNLPHSSMSNSRLYFLHALCHALIKVIHGENTWRETKVVFLPKPGKDSYQKPNSWRPISLTSFLLKTMERLVDWNLRTEELVNKMVNSGQYAYLKGIGTDAALHQLITRIEYAIKSKQMALGVFLDIEGAFSHATFKSIVTALEREGVSAGIIRWIYHMLSDRVVSASSGSTTERRVVERGCPQGGVLSPLLWNLVIMELQLELKNLSALYNQAYADDVALLNVGIDFGTVKDLSQRAIDTVDTWCKKRDLSIHPDKIEVVLFKARQKSVTTKPLKLHGKEISYKKSVRFLGVILDEELNWAEHCSVKAKRATASLMQVRGAVGKLWGLSPKVTHWVYTAVIRPVVSYASVAWLTATATDARLVPFRKLQRLACLMITGAIRSTPTAAMECMLDIEPIDVFLMRQAIGSSFRLRESGKWLSWKGRGSTKRITHVELVSYEYEKIADTEDIKSAGSDWSLTERRRRWTESTDCQQTKLFLLAPDAKASKYIIRLSRESIRILTQAVTGHSFLAKHQFVMFGKGSPLCPLCGQVDETSAHHIAECPSLVLQRCIYLGKCMFLVSELHDLPLSDVLSFCSSVGRIKG